MLDPNAVYKLHNANLGDHLTSYCLMTILGQRHRVSYKLETLGDYMDFSGRLEQIDGLFSECLYRPALVKAHGTVKVDPWLNWCYPALPVNLAYQWKRCELQRTFCYQFDGISAAEDKNPPTPLVAEIKAMLRQNGYRGIRLGAHMTLAEAATAMSTCALFVGCDSGFSHLAHSVGCPVYMYEGTLHTYTTHKLKQADVFYDLPTFVMKAEHWLKLLSL